MAKTVQPSPRTLASRRNGALGGRARARNNSKDAIRTWGAKGGNATQSLYSSDFKVFMGKQRKHVGRYRTPVEETQVGKRKPKKLAKAA